MKPGGMVAQWLTGRVWKVTCWNSRPKYSRRQTPRFRGDSGSNHHRRQRPGNVSAGRTSGAAYATVSLAAVTAGLLPGGRPGLLGGALRGAGVGAVVQQRHPVGRLGVGGVGLHLPVEAVQPDRLERGAVVLLSLS